jgi:hypothetical protein
MASVAYYLLEELPDWAIFVDEAYPDRHIRTQPQAVSGVLQAQLLACR